MKNLILLLVFITITIESIAQPDLTIWITPDGYHHHHDHEALQEYLCDSSYYIFYNNPADTVTVTIKNEGTEILSLTSATVDAIEGAKFEIVDFVPVQIGVGEMFAFDLAYELSDTYIDGINGQLTIHSNDPMHSSCRLYFDVGCTADLVLSLNDEFNLDASCSSPIVWVADFNSLSNPKWVYGDSMNFYSYDGFAANKALEFDFKARVNVPNQLSVAQQFLAGQTSTGFAINADSSRIHIKKKLEIEADVDIDNKLRVLGNTSLQGLSVAQDLNVFGMLTVQDVIQPSDVRLKQDITPISNALAAIMHLDPKSYRMKNHFGAGDRAFGFIAQELESIIPEVVHTNNASDLKAVNYIQLIPFLTAALQEQQLLIEQLENRVLELEKR